MIQIIKLSKITFVSLMFVLMGDAYASEEPLITNIEVTYLSEDNITRGFLENDVQSDEIMLFTVGLKQELELNRLAALFFSADFTDKQYSEFDLLSSSTVRGRVDYVFQTGFRFANPTYTLSAAIEESDYGSNLRDSSSISFSAKLLKRLTTRIKTSLGFSYALREADTNVFDIKTAKLFALVDYSVSSKLSLYASITANDGGSVSTIFTSDADLLAQQIGYATINEADAAGALLPDDAFGGAANDQFAYQNESRTRIAEFGANYALNNHHAVDLSVKTVRTKLDTGLKYDNYLLQLSYIARF